LPFRRCPRRVIAVEFDGIVDPVTMVGNPRRDLGLEQANGGAG
jgi:hypothetical protein